MTATAVRAIEFKELTHDEIEAVLERNKVGRLAFTFHDRVDIQPIHYVYERGWLFGRTSDGSKLATLRHNQWIAFEVDEVSGVFDWRSVVVHGSFWLAREHGTPHSEEVYRRAVSLLDTIVPGTLTENDPVPFRQVVFRIAVTAMRGRSAREVGAAENKQSKESR
jgi:nitroimidazol reductase NimA-like FMN-containing flavoprotein (pyridoxamine 5'-phosphate oxidase superfamily)